MEHLPLSITSGLVIYGPLGIFCVIEGFVIGFLYRENKNLQGKIYDLLEKSRDTVIEPLKNIQDMSRAMLTILESIAGKKQ